MVFWGAPLHALRAWRDSRASCAWRLAPRSACCRDYVGIIGYILSYIGMTEEKNGNYCLGFRVRVKNDARPSPCLQIARACIGILQEPPPNSVAFVNSVCSPTFCLLQVRATSCQRFSPRCPVAKAVCKTTSPTAFCPTMCILCGLCCKNRRLTVLGTMLVALCAALLASHNAPGASRCICTSPEWAVLQELRIMEPLGF